MAFEMDQDNNIMKSFIKEIYIFISPLLDADKDKEDWLDFFESTGWDLRAVVGNAQGYSSQISDFIAQFIDVFQTIAFDIKDIVQNGPPKNFNELKLDIEKVGHLVQSLEALTSEARNTFDSFPEFSDQIQQMPGDILNALVLSYIYDKNKSNYYLFKFLGFIHLGPQEKKQINGFVFRTKNKLPYIDFKAIVEFIKNPKSYFLNRYFPNGSFDSLENVNQTGFIFFSSLSHVLTTFNLNAEPGNGFFSQEVNDSLGKHIDRLKGLIRIEKRHAGIKLDHGQAIPVEFYIEVTIGFLEKIKNGPGIFMIPKGGGSYSNVFGRYSFECQMIFPSQGFAFTNDGLILYAGPASGSSTINAYFRLSRIRLPGEQKITLWGNQTGSRIDVSSISIHGILDWGNIKKEIGVQLNLNECALVIKKEFFDGFLKQVIPIEALECKFDLSIGYSNLNGFHFAGSGGLEINLSKNINLGPIELLDSKIRISPQLGEKPGIANSFGTTLKGNLGPLKAVIEDLGLKFNLGFPPDMKGNLGLIDLDLGIKPPKGVGLSIDAHGFRGGGYLFIDVEKGEYAGALELEVFKMFTLKALGIITTKLPDGSPGFSLLILITAEFQAVQLGFGFTLNGVGGLLGLNRTSNMEEIGRRVKTGTSGEIFFPKNLVANVKSVISGMKTVFPEHQGNFVFGPVGRIGWGTPTIVEVELGLVIDVPDPVRVAIIGAARMDLPHRDVWPRVIQLRMAFAVSVDFGKKMFALNATLFDSRIVLFTISGDMVLRIGWGANPMFIFSIGGFHPKYREAPADLQNMNRLSIRALDLPFIKMGYDLYLAITSNTVQFGINAYLLGKVLNVEASGSFEFDVLFQFNPFYFVASVSCKAALIIDLGFLGRHELFAIHIYGELSGPKPWHIVGRASFKILWFELSFNLEHEWGDKAEIIPLVKVNVLNMLREEFSKALNWQGIPDPGSVQGVTIGQIAPEDLVLFPSTTLRVSQKVAPLGLNLEKIGEEAIEGATKFEITSIEIGGSPALTESFVKEQFAPANFLKLSDDEKIARPSFEMMQGGVSFKVSENGNKTEGNEVPVTIEYEVNYLKAKERQTVKVKDGRQMKELKTLPLTTAQFNRESRGSAAFRTPFSRETTRPSHHAPQPIRKREVGYQVVDAADNNKVLHEGKFGSQAEAFQFLVAEAQKDSTRQLEVVTQYN
jgi:hypothetical protein